MYVMLDDCRRAKFRTDKLYQQHRLQTLTRVWLTVLQALKTARPQRLQTSLAPVLDLDAASQHRRYTESGLLSLPLPAGQ